MNLHRLILLVVLVLFLITSPALALTIWLWLGHLELTEAVQWFGGGLVIGILIFAVLTRVHGFWAAFKHETTHMIAGLICFIRPVAFSVNPDGSGMYQARRTNLFVRLAPYFLPVFNLILLGVYPLLRYSMRPWFWGVFGLSSAWHVVTVIAQAKPHQSDIIQSGLATSAIIIGWGNLFFFGITLAFVMGQFLGIQGFMIDFYTEFVSHLALLVPV